MKTSIAMATCNGAMYIEEQLQSILHQNCLPHELVVFDDDSTDATVEIIEHFREAAPFEVHIYRNKERIGYAANFAQAIAACSSEIVLLSDQDDRWLPEKIQVIVDVFAKQPDIQVLIHDLEFCDASLTPIGQRKIERMSSYTDPAESYVTGAATAMRKNFFNLLQPFPAVDFLGHDDWIHSCANLIEKKSVIPAVLAMYRRHGTNATSGTALNSATVTTAKDFKAGRATTDTRPTLYTRIVTWKLLAGWLKAHQEVLVEQEYTSQEKIEKTLNNLNLKLHWGQKRSMNLSRSRAMRVLPVLAMLISGGYAFFSGAKSAGKDIFYN